MPECPVTLHELPALLLKASCGFLFWTCLTFLLSQGFLCCLRKPTTKSGREHTSRHRDGHAKFAAITRTFNCHFQCEQIHFPPHDLLGYKRLVLFGLVTWMLLYLFALFFLVIHDLFRSNPVQRHNKDSMFSHSNYGPFSRAITQDYKNSYNAFKKEKEKQQPPYLATKINDFVETCLKETLSDFVLSSH